MEILIHNCVFMDCYLVWLLTGFNPNPIQTFTNFLWTNSTLQVLLECSGEQNHGQVLRKLQSTLAERGIEEMSVLLLLKEVEDSSMDSAGILSKCLTHWGVIIRSTLTLILYVNYQIRGRTTALACRCWELSRTGCVRWTWRLRSSGGVWTNCLASRPIRER